MSLPNRERESKLSQDRLKALLDYNSETGKFTRRCKYRGSYKAGSKDKKGYLQIGVAGHKYAAHRLAWLYVHGVWPKEEIDHRNGNRLDNRIANLRDVPKRVNLCNRKSSSSLPGVTFDKRTGRWMARIRFNGKLRLLGRYTTEQEAGDVASIAHKIAGITCHSET